MTAPFDARYLVPVSALPFIPGGATPVRSCTACGSVNVRKNCSYCGDSSYDHHCNDNECRDCGGAGAVHIDLSAPAGDPPTRLDALPWALAVLAKRIGYRIDTIDELRPMIWSGSTTWAFDVFGVGYVAVLRPEDPGWEDYDHADPNRPRRIVAAALRNHVQKEPTP